MAKIKKMDKVLAKMWSNQNSHTSLVSLPNGMNTLENNLALFEKLVIHLSLLLLLFSP